MTSHKRSRKKEDNRSSTHRGLDFLAKGSIHLKVKRWKGQVVKRVLRRSVDYTKSTQLLHGR